MDNLRIFCDAALGARATELLRQGVAPHRLVFAQQRGDSVLAAAALDPGILEADIAFGQPGVDSVLQAKRLRWLQLTSAGFTRYDTPDFRAAAADRGLLVTNSSSVYAEACAEHVFAFMLAQARKLPSALGAPYGNGSAAWDHLRNESVCLHGQSVLILGFGTIAARLVEMLQPFRMEITAMRRRPQGNEAVPVVTEDDLGAVLATADHVINILPDNPASVGFISASRLAGMKPGAIFYNIGRGTTVDQDALVASLQAGHLGAAWLDVTDPEPLPDEHPLRTTPNCFITPHTAGGHRNEAETLVHHFLANFSRFVQGTPLADRIM